MKKMKKKKKKMKKINNSKKSIKFDSQFKTMKNLFVISVFLFYLCEVNLIVAQQKAVTETGEEVILYMDGTWNYMDKDHLLKKEIPTNPNNFIKDSKSTFLIKSSSFNIGFYIDPKKWSFKKAPVDEPAEYELESKDGDLYGMVITEKAQIPLESFRLIAIENAKSGGATDIKITKEEYRNVNGLKILLLQMKGTISGIKACYYGYYFSNENGTVQFLTYTTQNLIDSYIPKIEKLLNGLVEL